MTVLIFLLGSIVFILFITSFTSEIKKLEDIDYENYYERHSIQRKKNPKTKKGSQSRMKNYNWKK
jgi:hypothetical protein